MLKNIRFILFTLITIVYFTSSIGVVSDADSEPYGIKLAGVGNLTVDIPKGNGDVLYTFRITNTGTKLDTISLTTNGDVKSTLSRDSVSLAPGASTDVVMSISDDVLSNVGRYEVNVIATSNGDPTKTATITTTTTIFTCGVEISSVGETTIETTDAGTKASYIIRITNVGSRSDTITIATSGDVDISISETSVELAAGTSTDVTVTINELVLAEMLSTPGEYTVTVTATSKNVSSETAEITTTIAIEQLPWDLTGDSVVNILDLVKVANAFGNVGDGLVSDVTLDGVVNILDLVQVASHFGETQLDYALANFNVSHKPTTSE